MKFPRGTIEQIITETPVQPHTQPLSSISGTGNSAGLDVGTTSNTVAAGNDSRIVNAESTLNKVLTVVGNESSNTLFPTAKAVADYVGANVAGLLKFQGPIELYNTTLPAANKGFAYHVVDTIGSGTIQFGIAGVEVGDMLVCKLDGTAANTPSKWYVIQGNIDGALVAANNLADLTNPQTARESLSLSDINDVKFASVKTSGSGVTVQTSLALSASTIERVWIQPTGITAYSSTNNTIPGVFKSDGGVSLIDSSVISSNSIALNRITQIPPLSILGNATGSTGTIAALSGSLARAAIGLGNVPNTDATNPANTIQTSGFRYVTDAEKASWSGKVDARIGDVVFSTTAPSAGTWIAPGIYNRVTYPALSPLITTPPALQTLVKCNYPRGGFTCGAIRPSDGRIVLGPSGVATGNNIVISDDNGITWFSIIAPAIITQIVYTGAAFIAVSNTTGYWRSVDGITWVRLPTTETLRSVATDGAGKVVFGTSTTLQRYSTDHGLTTNTVGNAASVNGSFAVTYTGVVGNEFAIIDSSGIVYTVNSTTWTITTRNTATGMNQLSYGNGRLLASASAGTATPRYSDDVGVSAFNPVSNIGASCRNFVYSTTYSTWYGLIGANNSQALYYSSTGISGWQTFNIGVYGIGLFGMDIGGSRFLIAGTNTTAAAGANSSNIRLLNTATTVNAIQPMVGVNTATGSTFACGDMFGKLYAMRSGDNTQPMAMMYDGTLWKTLPYNANWFGCNIAYDLGSNTGIVLRGSANNILRSADGGATWNTVSINILYHGYDAANDTCICIDSANQLRRSFNKYLTVPSVVGGNLVLGGFIFGGVPLKVYGKWFIPGQDASLRGAFAVSDDNGTTWTTQTVDAAKNIIFNDISTDGTTTLAFVYDGSQIFGTTDGINWSCYSPGIAQSSATLWYNIYYSTTRKCWFIFNGASIANGVAPILVSYNGRVWKQIGASNGQLQKSYYSVALDRIVLCSNSTSLISNILLEEPFYDNATQFMIEDMATNKNIQMFTRAS